MTTDKEKTHGRLEKKIIRKRILAHSADNSQKYIHRADGYEMPKKRWETNKALSIC